MQKAKSKFEAEGISIVGLSYDNPQILGEFAKRQGIEFPLLSDSDSSSLEALGLVNPEATGMTEGVAFPGIIYLDSQGKIVDAFFEDSYRDRPTPGTVLARLFPQKAVAGEEPDKDQPFTLSQTGDAGIMGSQWELLVTFNLPEKAHLYAPNEDGYVALELVPEDNEFFEFGKPVYPEPETLELEVLDQKVPVYSGLVTVRLPIKVAGTEKVKSLKETVTTRLRGKLSYQICTDTTCFMPQSVDVEWTAVVKPLDRQRSDESIRH